MPHSISNPEGLHKPATYSHVATASGELVLIAGQYASDGNGRVVSADFAEQVRRSFANLRTALTSVGLGFEHVVQLRSHIVAHDAGKLAVLGGRIVEIWGDEPPTQTLSGVAALAYPDMLFEVDAIAVRP
ncbi:RidA family protein [Actinomadura sp. KC345]|uniref:RidA family protein n=1 Tax=Actinomadura sp. KC345 TaxID=2530371 RepID=UPI00104BB707|nr:RidA family protein [Actinomadura sp. KC345]TDC55216.1 RidA family protein [Actinomadura sp. KC345]